MTRSISILAGLALLPTLHGCSRPEIRTDAPASVPARPSFAASNMAGHMAGQSGRVQADWLAQFDDPALRSLVDEALANNPDLRAASARVDQALALAAKAGAPLLPTLDLGAGAAYRDVGRNADPAGAYSLGLQSSWELDVWGRLRSAQAAARFDAEAAQLDRDFAADSLAASVARGWFLAIGAGEQLSVAEELLAVRQRTLAVVGARRSAGVAQPIDLSVAKADVDTAKSGVEAARESRLDALRSLELLLGRHPAAELATGPTLPAPPDPMPAGLPSELLERRPDLVAADRRVAAAIGRRESAKAARLPSLSLTASLGTASDELRDVLNPENAVWNLGANLLAPIFDGGRRRADSLVAEAQQREALASYVQACLRALGDVESSLAAEVFLRSRAEQLDRAVAELATARNAAELRYRQGLLSIFDLTQVEARLYDAKSQAVAVRTSQFVQRTKLCLALGGGHGPVADKAETGTGDQ
ncbi:MAG: TolC family protein [Phycisphaerae bacterium]|jgi:NodT family efflux transporter outer membrane factor (OMF) lipoprotein